MDLTALNPEQRRAAETLEGPVLILAGAGSGKTRALTYRVANLIDHGVPAWSILALTFTNKAAKEMKERVARLIGAEKAEEAWISTFHSTCARILRRDIEKIGYNRSFTIFDDDDQQLKVAEGTIAWALSSGASVTSEVPTYSPEFTSDYFTGSDISIGSKLTVMEKSNSAGQTQTGFQPTEQASAATDDNAINILVTLKDGYEFVPTKVAVNASRYGTNGGTVDMLWVNGDGGTNKLLTGQTPERSADESNGTTHDPYYTALNKDITGAKATTGTFGVRLHVYGIASNKQIGLCDMLISGKIFSTSATGIREQVSDVTLGGSYYNLQGVRIERPTKGVYIHNGRKVVVK